MRLAPRRQPGAGRRERLAGCRALRQTVGWGLWGLLCVVLPGCHTTNPHATTQPAMPRDGNAELILYISDQPYVTAEPAYRAVSVLAHGAAFDGDFEELAAALREAGLIGGGWRYAPDQCLDRAAIGFMICRACEIRTGLNWLLTSLGRYAWRELQYKAIAGPGSEFGLLSGGEFVGLLSRAEDYLQRTGKGEVNRVKLGTPSE